MIDELLGPTLLAVFAWVAAICWKRAGDRLEARTRKAEARRAD